jgi:hypothetical protein
MFRWVAPRSARYAAPPPPPAATSTAATSSPVRALTECEDEDAYYDFGVDLFVAGVERLHASAKRHNREL